MGVEDGEKPNDGLPKGGKVADNERIRGVTEVIRGHSAQVIRGSTGEGCLETVFTGSDGIMRGTSGRSDEDE